MSFLRGFLVFFFSLIISSLFLFWGVAWWLSLLISLSFLIIYFLKQSKHEKLKIWHIVLFALFLLWGAWRGSCLLIEKGPSILPDDSGRSVFTNVTLTLQSFPLISPRTDTSGQNIYTVSSREGIRLFSSQISTTYPTQTIRVSGRIYTYKIGKTTWRSLYLNESVIPANVPPLPPEIMDTLDQTSSLIPPALQILNSGIKPLELISWVRASASRLILHVENKEVKSLLFSLILGNRLWLNQNSQEAFRRSGVSHILALSGLHVGILSVLLLNIFQLFMKRKSAYLITSALVLFYIFFAGLTPSLVRAGFLFITYNLLQAAGHDADWLDVLAFTAFIILSFHPQALFEAGFLLSYGATLGIVLISPFIQKFLRPLPAWLTNPVSITFAATLATIPITLAFFGGFSLAGLLVNLVIIPLFLVLLPGLLLQFLLLTLGLSLIPLQTSLSFIWNIMNSITDYSTRFSWSYLETPGWPLLLSYALMTGLLFFLFMLPALRFSHKKQQITSTLA